MGNERDLHTPHWHGKVVQYGMHHTDVIELLPGSMEVADMIADNPGTWMLHCHVADHMESGMMANYTIYGPQPSCSSPVEFPSADFWSTPGKFKFTVRNTSSKPIQRMVVTYDHLVTSIYRRRPFENYWQLNKPIQPGMEETFEFPGYPNGADEIAGWVLYPQMVTFADGSHWDSGSKGECYKIFWRDKDHPELPVLPPLFVESHED